MAEVAEASIHNIMGGIESTGGVRLHNHNRKLKQRFDIIKKLGQGTYGKVQLGINKETGQEVAIKTIKKCKIQKEADLIRIRREVQIMSSVQHPNIIHIYEVFENKEKMVLVMEYAAGGELYDYLNGRKVLPEEEARRIFRQISIAVFYCHKHKICHRDLKLENILLDQIGNAKIADFGLSNVFDGQRLLNTFCGSPLYASPEIVKGTPYHGPEVDCWSLGVLLYTLVYGAMPFDGSNFKRLTRQICTSDYYEPKIRSPASRLIKDMMRESPSKRADIVRICSHWWVNEGYEENCLDIAEDLAAQTPVRLDLLLSLVPQSASAEKLVVGDERSVVPEVESAKEAPQAPARSHSMGSLMELENRQEKPEVALEDAAKGTSGEAKRKLETTPSMEEAAGSGGGAKRKERVKKKEKCEENRPHRFSTNRHHSAPIPNPIVEESMEFEPGMAGSVRSGVGGTHLGALLDLCNEETANACLELIKESLSKSPSKERSKTPVGGDETGPKAPISPENSKKFELPTEQLEKGREKKISEFPPASISKQEISPKDESEKVLSGEIISDKSAEKAKFSNPEKFEKMENGQKSENSRSIGQDERKKDEEKDTRRGKKMHEKALSLDSAEIGELSTVGNLPTERRKSKIFETAEKFNQFAATGTETEKPKKIFIPGVNVGGAKRAFERKASLSSITGPPQPVKSASKVIIDVPTSAQERKNSCDEKLFFGEEKSKKIEEEKKRAVDIITGAIGKPPMQKKINGSSPTTPQSPEAKKLPLKIQLGPNDLRNATVSVSTPVDTKFPFETKFPTQFEVSVPNSPDSRSLDSSYADEPTQSSKMEITLKSATLPRPARKTSKAEITLAGVRKPEAATRAFKSEVEAKIDAFVPQKLRTQRSEVAFPVAAVVPQANRSSSLEPESAAHRISPKEHIIPIQVEMDSNKSPAPAKPPMMPQRSMSQRSGSLSRQSTADSDTDSALGSTIGPEPIRKSPREYIIPIAVEGGGYVTPRSGSLEPESKAGSTPTSANPPNRSRFGHPRRMSSLLSDASEDESPFSTLHRDSDDLLQRHMHRLRSSRPTRQPPEHADSLSSGEDDDDDGFELLTAENLFSTLLSRVRSLTQRLNVDDSRSGLFPSGRLLGRLGSNSSQGFWGLHEPLSRRLSDSQFRRSLSRDGDRFGKRDSAVASGTGTPNSPGTPSRESVFELGSGSNTLPRGRKGREDAEILSEGGAVGRKMSRKEPIYGGEQNFTPNLARRLSRQFIEQTRHSLPRSSSIPREGKKKQSAGPIGNDREGEEDADFCYEDRTAVRRGYSGDLPIAADRPEYRSRSCDRFGAVNRPKNLFESNSRADLSLENLSPRGRRRRSVGLFAEDDDAIGKPKETIAAQPKSAVSARETSEKDFEELLNRPSRQTMTLGRKPYRDPAKTGFPNFHTYRAEKIQEEPNDDFSASPKAPKRDENKSFCGTTSNSEDNRNRSPYDRHGIGDYLNLSNNSAASLDPSEYPSRSCETSPTESSSSMTIGNDYSLRQQESASRDFETRLLAAENLIKESKIRNLGSYDRNLSSSYLETDKCDKELSASIGNEAFGNVSAKRRSCIPSLRLRSGSLSRESALAATADRRNTVSCGADQPPSASHERSLLSKLFRAGSTSGRLEHEPKEKSAKSAPRRISRFLRPDFFDTPREESQYVKEKEAQKAAENERRKSRFMRKKNEAVSAVAPTADDRKPLVTEKPDKEMKNEVNALTREKTGISAQDNKQEEASLPIVTEPKIDKQPPKSGFFQTIEKKLEKFRSNDAENGAAIGNRASREKSAPPIVSDSCGKSASSTEEICADDETRPGTSKSRVSTVLGLFKNDSAKVTLGAKAPQQPQNTILSKFKKNPYKGSRSDGVLTSDQSASSKIPTKFGKIDGKSEVKMASAKVENKMDGKTASKPFTDAKTEAKPKKIGEMKKSPEKTMSDVKKKSPSKEKSPADRKSAERQLMRITKPKSPDKTVDTKPIDKAEKLPSAKENSLVSRKKSDSPEKSVTRPVVKKSSPEKTPIDNKQSEMVATAKDETDDKTKVMKPKKSVKSLTSLVKNGTVGKLEKAPDDAEKKPKKIVKAPKESEKTETCSDGTKKKKIVRVVKKVGKIGEGAETGKSDEKEKKPSLMKKITGTKKESSPEKTRKIGKEKSPPSPIKAEKSVRTHERSPESKTIAKSDRKSSTTSSNSGKIGTQSSTEISDRSELSLDSLGPIKDPEIGLSNGSSSSHTDLEPKNPIPIKSSRTNLKLDLTKIPQHASFKSTSGTKKDSPKAENCTKPKSPQVSPIFQPISTEPTDPKIAEKLPIPHEDSARPEKALPPKIPDLPQNEPKPKSIEPKSAPAQRPTNLPLAEKKSAEFPEIGRNDLISPNDDAETSFDTWSVCSGEPIGNHRRDLMSPISPPIYSPLLSPTSSSRLDHNPESIIDRIRRKSFYCRFNERKRRPSLNNPSQSAHNQPSSYALTTSSTLPRKFTFNSLSRDEDRYRRPNVYGPESAPSRRLPERTYSLYNDESAPNYYYYPYGKAGTEGEPNYGEGNSLSPENRPKNEQFHGIGDQYRKYRISSSPDSPIANTHRKYENSAEPNEDDRRPCSPRSVSDLPSSDTDQSRKIFHRKYSAILPETKSADYFEELLSPSRSDYLISRKTPNSPNDLHFHHHQPIRHENGYHNGSFDCSDDKWKNFTDHRTSGLPCIDGRSDKQSLRCGGDKKRENPDAATGIAEENVSDAPKIE